MLYYVAVLLIIAFSSAASAVARSGPVANFGGSPGAVAPVLPESHHHQPVPASGLRARSRCSPSFSSAMNPSLHLMFQFKPRSSICSCSCGGI